MRDNLFSFSVVVRPKRGAAPDEDPIRSLDIDAAVQAALSSEVEARVADFLGGRDPVDYEPGYTPEEDQILQIRDFTLPPAMVSALTLQAGSTSFNVDELLEGRVRSVAAFQPAFLISDAYAVFLPVRRGNVLRKAWYNIVLTRDTFRRLDSDGLIFPASVGAVFQGGTLFFESFLVANACLPLSANFEEASDAQLAEFASSACFFCEDVEKFKKAADVVSRRKVAQILSRDIVSSFDLGVFIGVADKYGVVSETKKVDGAERLVIPLERQHLKPLLRLLNEDYLESLLTSQSYQVSSKRRFKV